MHHFLIALCYVLEKLYLTNVPLYVGRLLGAVVVIAANAGGAWTPIGDVTTTMLWIHGQISTVQTMKVILSLFSAGISLPHTVQ